MIAGLPTAIHSNWSFFFVVGAEQDSDSDSGGADTEGGQGKAGAAADGGEAN